jgi:cAMP phosphodiesterase
VVIKVEVMDQTSLNHRTIMGNLQTIMDTVRTHTNRDRTWCKTLHKLSRIVRMEFQVVMQAATLQGKPKNFFS